MKVCPDCRRPRVESEEEWRAQSAVGGPKCGRTDDESSMSDDEAIPDCERQTIAYLRREVSWQKLVLEQSREAMRKAQRRIRGGDLYDELGATMSRIDRGYVPLPEEEGAEED
jgi:hypothetical protein